MGSLTRSWRRTSYLAATRAASGSGPTPARPTARWLRHLHDGVAEIACHLLGAPSIRLLQDALLLKHPSARGSIALHQDYSYTGFLDPPSIVSVGLALNDASAESGCLHVIDGSHTWGLVGGLRIFADALQTDLDQLLSSDQRESVDRRRIPLEVRAGDVTIHHCLTLHGSDDNRSSRPRKTIVTHLFSGECRLVARSTAARQCAVVCDRRSGTPDGANVSDVVSDGSRACRAPVRGGTRMKVLLIAPPIMDVIDGDLQVVGVDALRECPPLGIYALAAVLDAQGHEAVIADLILQGSRSLGAFEQELDTADLVGVGSTSMAWPTALDVIAQVRQRRPDVPIVCGGIHPTLFDRYILGNFPVQFVGTGRGRNGDWARCAARSKAAWT